MCLVLFATFSLDFFPIPLEVVFFIFCFIILSKMHPNISGAEKKKKKVYSTTKCNISKKSFVQDTISSMKVLSFESCILDVS